MNAKLSMFVICVEAIIYVLLYNFHGCTFKVAGTRMEYPEGVDFRGLIFTWSKLLALSCGILF